MMRNRCINHAQFALAWDVARLLVGICAAAVIVIAELVLALLFVDTR